MTRMTRLLSIWGLFAALFAGLIGPPTRAAADETPQEIYRKSIGGVVWIENHLPDKSSNMGSGFLVDAKRKLVVTNFHVALAEDTMDVFFPVRDKNGRLIGDPQYYRSHIDALQKTGHYAAGRVIARDPHKDLVILAISALPSSAVELSLATSDPGPSDELHMLGNPAGRELWRWGPAIKPRLSRFQGRYIDFPVEMDYKQIRYSSNSFGGNSGGPVLNGDGKVVGVHSSGGGDGGMNGGAIHYSEVASLLATITPHRVFAIANPTKSTLYYQIRWGDGEWKETKLPPDKVMTHWLRGEDGGVAQIRFDRSAEPGYQEQLFNLDYFTVNLGLNVKPSPDDDAKVYYFEYDKSGQNLGLYGKKK